jgi:hypothetical protein
MRNGFFPIFTKGRVLKRESVEYLRDFPNDIATLTYEQYSDGILFGFGITSENGFTHITRGAIKHQGNIMIVPENTIRLTDYAEFMYAKLIIGKTHETADYKSCPIEIKVDRNQIKAENEKELGRFCLNSGAILRCKYDSFSDLRTLENTLDLTRVAYAGYEAPTLHPKVMKEYARALLTSSSEPADVAFALMCMNTWVVHKRSIEWHVAKKRNREYEEYTLPQLYEKLLELLPQTGFMGKRERPRGRGPTIV